MLRSCSIVLGAILLAACNHVRVEEVRGPDGEWARISCRHMDRRCFDTAARMCPSGYYLASPEGALPVHMRQVGEVEEPRADVKTLPPQESWSREMYSWNSGVILVRCAGERTASNEVPSFE